ncbi:MAG: hypothetical protein IT337_08740 [Thermomicrobiales bacterium]|nr:hypothetical protein [Thermomicrobiales bacterium]
MAKELSELLADLSAQAKETEDAFAAIAVETDARAEERRDKTRAAATEAIDRLNESAASAGDAVAGHWHALNARIDAEIEGIRTGIAERKHERDLNQAEKEASAAKERATRAIAFAAAAVQTAGVAVLDSAVAQREADAIKRR